MAELADAQDLGSCARKGVWGSRPSIRTTNKSGSLLFVFRYPPIIFPAFANILIVHDVIALEDGPRFVSADL